MRKRYLLSSAVFAVLTSSVSVTAAPTGPVPGVQNTLTPAPAKVTTTTANAHASGSPQGGSSPIQIQEKQAAAAALDYWTEDRMKAAKPREMLVDPSRFPVANTGEALTAEPEVIVPGKGPKKGLNVGRRAAEQAPLTQADPLAGTYPYDFTTNPTSALKNYYPLTTIGKLFFTLNGTNYVCSASVIRPHLLLAARHCVFDYGTGAWATNVVFYPGYDSGANTLLGPSNGWAQRTAYTWVSNAAGWQYDIAFIQTFNKNRTGCAATASNPQIENYTGFLGYKYGGSYDNRHFDSFGYPAASPFNGLTQQQSETFTGALDPFGETNTIEVGSDLTGGASGGPWLTKYKLSSAISTVNLATSLNSFKWTTPAHPSSMVGPQFTSSNFLALLNGAVALPCP